MPPSVKITREMILDAAFDLVRREGHEHLSARRVSEALRCSTQPVMYNYKTAEALRQAVYARTDAFHTRYILPGEGTGDPLLELGMNYIRFAHEEGNLFRFLFQSGQLGGRNLESLTEDPEAAPILALAGEALGGGPEAAKEAFLGLFAAVHGLASLLANTAMDYEEQRFRRLLMGLFEGMTAGEGETEHAEDL